jgi:hypothetical protein
VADANWDLRDVSILGLNPAFGPLPCDRHTTPRGPNSFHGPDVKVCFPRAAPAPRGCYRPGVPRHSRVARTRPVLPEVASSTGSRYNERGGHHLGVPWRAAGRAHGLRGREEVWRSLGAPPEAVHGVSTADTRRVAGARCCEERNP